MKTLIMTSKNKSFHKGVIGNLQPQTLLQTSDVMGDY